MVGSWLHPNGWVSLHISLENEEKAKEIRAERDLQYGNIFSVARTDERWVGDLGEIVFNSWLNQKGLKNFEWLKEDAAGRPDFVTEKNVKIGVKTVKRQDAPKPGYTAQITARHAMEPIDHFFFMTYEISARIMWLLGGIDREIFLGGARYYGAGEMVHKHYQVREGHEIYNIEMEKLLMPDLWLRNIDDSFDDQGKFNTTPDGWSKIPYLNK